MPCGAWQHCSFAFDIREKDYRAFTLRALHRVYGDFLRLQKLVDVVLPDLTRRDLAAPYLYLQKRNGGTQLFIYLSSDSGVCACGNVMCGAEEEKLYLTRLKIHKRWVSLRNLISDASRDKIVILATHIVSDIDMIADKVILLDEGSLKKT